MRLIKGQKDPEGPKRTLRDQDWSSSFRSIQLFKVVLISVALTFHGTEHEARRFQGYEGICEDICEKPENTSGQNCCRGNSGTYLDGSYDYACKNGRCTLRGPLSSPGFRDGEGVYQCSDLVHCSKDDSSEESTEDPIVDVGVSVVGPGNGKGRQPTRRPRNMEDDDHMNTRTNQSMLYAQGMRGSEGSGGSEGSRPGSL